MKMIIGKRYKVTLIQVNDYPILGYFEAILLGVAYDKGDVNKDWPETQWSNGVTLTTGGEARYELLDPICLQHDIGRWDGPCICIEYAYLFC